VTSVALFRGGENDEGRSEIFSSSANKTKEKKVGQRANSFGFKVLRRGAASSFNVMQGKRLKNPKRHKEHPGKKREGGQSGHKTNLNRGDIAWRVTGNDRESKKGGTL